WLEEDDDVNENVNNEDIEDEDVEIKVDNDAELIFPYEVEGDQTPPPKDESFDSEPPNTESSDSVSSDSESEDEEAYIRLTEAELGACQTEIALLKSKNKIGEKERELLDHDLENVEHALGNVLERVSALESGENATLKKRLDETDTKLAWARMERDIAEKRLHVSRVWNKMFYLDMVCIGAVPNPPSDDEDTEHPRKKSKNSTSDGTEGPSEPRSRTSLLELYSIRWIMLPKAMSEARMREVIREQVATSMAEFMANMNRRVGGDGAGGGGAGGVGAGGAGAGGVGAGGARPAAPEITSVLT
ncbi:hypothetical protein Tco_1557838, partial [Tanacetum coccineum]